MNELNETALHEASHAAAAIFHGQWVDHAWRNVGHSFPGDMIGHARVPTNGEIGPERLVIALAGYMSTDTPDWPPSYEDARTERLEALGTTIRVLEVTEDQYAQFVELTRDLLANEHFIRLRDSIARALTVVPRLEREDIAALCHAANVPTPETQEQP